MTEDVSKLVLRRGRPSPLRLFKKTWYAVPHPRNNNELLYPSLDWNPLQYSIGSSVAHNTPFKNFSGNWMGSFCLKNGTQYRRPLPCMATHREAWPDPAGTIVDCSIRDWNLLRNSMDSYSVHYIRTFPLDFINIGPVVVSQCCLQTDKQTDRARSRQTSKTLVFSPVVADVTTNNTLKTLWKRSLVIDKL